MTKHVLNHPIPSPNKRNRTRSPSKGKRDDKGKACQRKKWQRRRACIMPKAHADAVTSASISMMTKLQPPLRIRSGQTPPAPKKKGKVSNAAPCLIGPNPKYACIAKKQPRVTSSSDVSSVSMKRVGSERSWPSSPRHTSSKRVLSCVQNIR